MHDKDFRSIETRLGISLPNFYRKVMRTKGERIVGAFGSNDDTVTLFGTAAEVVKGNRSNRSLLSIVAKKFPKWWRTFLIVGQSEFGEFCVRLDGTPRVWILGYEPDDVPIELASTFAQFVSHEIREAEKRQKESAQRRARFADERRMKHEVVAGANSPESKAWFEATSPQTLFDLLKNSGRRLHRDKRTRLGIAAC